MEMPSTGIFFFFFATILLLEETTARTVVGERSKHKSSRHHHLWYVVFFLYASPAVDGGHCPGYDVFNCVSYGRGPSGQAHCEFLYSGCLCSWGMVRIPTGAAVIRMDCDGPDEALGGGGGGGVATSGASRGPSIVGPQLFWTGG